MQELKKHACPWFFSSVHVWSSCVFPAASYQPQDTTLQETPQENKSPIANIPQGVQSPISNAGVGKKLGFIAQEMGREINTLGSKSNQSEMQIIVVKMKDILEQIKEQVLHVL